MFRKFDETMRYAFGEMRRVIHDDKFDGPLVYVINNDKLVDNWYRKNVRNEYFQMDGLWFFGEKEMYMPNGYTTESFWNAVKSNCSAFDVFVPCRIDVPPRRLPKLVVTAFNIAGGITKKVFREGQCQMLFFVNPKGKSGLNVKISWQTVIDIDNRHKKSSVIDCLQRLHQLVYGSIHQLDINNYFDEAEYSAFSLMILHHFNLNARDVIMSETDKCTFITVPYDKTIRFTRSDIDFLMEKNALMNRGVYFEITGTMETRAEFLSDRFEWYHLSTGYTKRWEEFLEWFI